MTSATWSDIVKYMWNDGLRDIVLVATRILTGVAICVLIGHYAHCSTWSVIAMFEDMFIGFGLVALYSAALGAIMIFASSVLGEFDPAYLTIVLSFSAILGAVIGPFVHNKLPYVSIYMLNGIGVVMITWGVIAFVLGVVRFVLFLQCWFRGYVLFIRSELERKHT